MNAQPYRIQVPEEVLQDLRERLARTRWPDEIPGSDWVYGSNLDYMKELVGYWRTGYSWRAQEESLNSFHHFQATVDGLDIHFIHERGRGPDPLPIIITHGWPSSFFEMYKIIPMLTDPASYGGNPADSFDVVVPSMPGYGFSGHPTRRGLSVARIADYWAPLMTEVLGYRRFAAQGGDWGASVTARLGYAYPDRLVGIHTTSVTGMMPYLGPGSRPLSDAERELLEQRAHWQRAEGGYSHIQGTKPQTLAYGLNDSPAGLAAWIVEKWRTWSDCDGDVERAYTKDELLTNVMVYWVTQSINSSTRLYYESQHYPMTMEAGEKIRVPSAIARFPKEISRPPREWAERSYNVQRFTDMPRGGHFAAMEAPDLLAQDIREFFRPLRKAA